MNDQFALNECWKNVCGEHKTQSGAKDKSWGYSGGSFYELGLQMINASFTPNYVHYDIKQISVHFRNLPKSLRVALSTTIRFCKFGGKKGSHHLSFVWL